MLTPASAAYCQDRLTQAQWEDGRHSAGYLSRAAKNNCQLTLFNCYTDNQAYDDHVDGAIRPVAGTHHRIRTDLAATLFLSPPDTYDGGELIVKESLWEPSAKLPAGDMVLYPGTSVHRVAPVTKGTRLAAFFWIQSMVRETSHRTVLFELDTAIQMLAKDMDEHASLVNFANVYHNLLRIWADA